METTTTNTSTNTSKYKCLSGSALKMIALITMMIDHVGSVLLSQAAFANRPFISIGSHALTLYFIVRK